MIDITLILNKDSKSVFWRFDDDENTGTLIVSPNEWDTLNKYTEECFPSDKFRKSWGIISDNKLYSIDYIRETEVLKDDICIRFEYSYIRSIDIHDEIGYGLIACSHSRDNNKRIKGILLKEVRTLEVFFYILEFQDVTGFINGAYRYKKSTDFLFEMVRE